MEIRLVGFQHYFQQVLTAFKQGTLHHSLLLSGIEGQGKAIFAQQLAYHILATGTLDQDQGYHEDSLQAIRSQRKKTEEEQQLGFGLLEDVSLASAPAVASKSSVSPKTTVAYAEGDYQPDPQNETYKKIVSGGHPDYILVSGDEGNVKVDSVRELIEFSHKTPACSKYRVIVVDNINSLNPSATNAILKLLEEPPKNLFMLLVTNNINELLETIPSRCLQLKIANPTKDEWLRAYKQGNFSVQELSPSAMDMLYELSQGSIGKTLKILRYNFATLHQELVDVLTDVHLNLGKLHHLVDKIGPDICPYWLLRDLLNNLLLHNYKILCGALPWDAEKLISTCPDAVYNLMQQNNQNFYLVEHLYMSEKQLFCNMLQNFKN